MFESGDHVVVNDKLPNLVGTTGTVTNPEYLGCVMVDPDDEELKQQSIGCFLPEELDSLPKQS